MFCIPDPYAVVREACEIRALLEEPLFRRMLPADGQILEVL